MHGLAAAVLVATPCLAQFQASNATARRVGLAVTELEVGLSTVDTNLRIDGAPFGVFLLALDTATPITPDRAFEIPGIANHLCIDPLSPGIATAAGLLDGSGEASLAVVMTAATAAETFHWQVLMLDTAAPNGWAVSNGVRRTYDVTTLIVPPLPFVATPAAPAIEAEGLDVEQGDIDGDGDPDTLVLLCNGQVWLVERAGDMYLTPVLLPGIGGPGSTSIELADLDNDNWLDLLSSHSSVGVRAFFNNGRVPASGSFLLGPWLGFTAGGTFNWVIPLSEEPRPAEDVETADIDGDGDLDFVLACAFAIQTRGSENRLFTNSGSHTFDEITRTDLNPTPFRDDTEDVEFYDLDDDDDYDIVFANVEGPASIHGVDFAYINQGGLQGGTLGSYVVAVSLRPARVTFTVPPADDQSLDAVVADFNGDGFGDVYFCNQGPFPLPPVPQPDTLYLSVLPGSWAAGVPAWTNASALLPDAPGGTVTPSWSVDAETADFDYDPSTVEIVISLGGRCNPREEGGMRMIRATRDPLAPAGLLPFAEVTAVELPPLVQRMSIIPGPAVYVNDIETGDFSGKTHERNFGLATGVDAFLGFTGHVWVAR